MLQKIETSKAIILFENDNFVIQSTIEVLETNLNDWIKSYPNLDSDKTLLNKIKELENKKGIKNVQEIAKNNGLTQRLLYRIADILKEGKCSIYNKKEKKIIEVIKIETYSYHCGSLCGEGGRRFFIDKQLLFYVVDWLS